MLSWKVGRVKITRIVEMDRKRVSTPTFRPGSGNGVMPAHERSF